MVFADDHANKKEFTPTKVDDESQCIYSPEQCLIDIKAWMDSNRLSHITKKCITAMLSFQKIKLIRRYLTKGTATYTCFGSSHFTS